MEDPVTMECGYCGETTTDCAVDLKAGPDAEMDVCRCKCGYITEYKVFDNGAKTVSTYPEIEAPEQVIKLLNEAKEGTDGT
jgi:hypothetical protein